MSFTGDLEHLPIVDVIQLLHSTRKSGVLRVKSRKGESQLVFKDGYIVSASHLNNTVRIGTLLVSLNIISETDLDEVLKDQQASGNDRKPLIITLLEKGLVNEKDAYKALEQLIEMTIVEILTWKKGNFTLEMLTTSITDEYKYYPDKMKQEVNIDTQSVLMDSLRIFDEKVRDGQLVEEEDLPEDAPLRVEEEPSLSADDLGLGDFESLGEKVPKVFKGVTIFDPCSVHREKIREAAPWLSGQEHEELALFLGNLAESNRIPEIGSAQDERSLTVIFYSPDELLKHAVTSACKAAGIHVFATNEERNLAPIIAQSLSKNNIPFLVMDAPEPTEGGFTPQSLGLLKQEIRECFPDLVTIQLANSFDFVFSLQSYGEGVKAVIPRPDRGDRRETYIRDLISFLECLPQFLRRQAFLPGKRFDVLLGKCFTSLRDCREVPEVAHAVLNFVADYFDRSLTLIVRDTELIAERGIGINSDKYLGVTPPLGFRIPLSDSPLLRKVLETGRTYYAPTDDAGLKKHLHAAIGVPLHPPILLLPLKNRDRTISLTYGDFGTKEVKPVETDLLDVFTCQAELAMEFALYRKKAEHPPR
jgi:hypothetical protein